MLSSIPLNILLVIRVCCSRTAPNFASCSKAVIALLSLGVGVAAASTPVPSPLFSPHLPGRSVFDLLLSARPGPSEGAGGRAKQKTGKQKTEGGAAPESPQTQLQE